MGGGKRGVGERSGGAEALPPRGGGSAECPKKGKRRTKTHRTHKSI